MHESFSTLPWWIVWLSIEFQVANVFCSDSENFVLVFSRVSVEKLEIIPIPKPLQPFSPWEQEQINKSFIHNHADCFLAPCYKVRYLCGLSFSLEMEVAGDL